MIEAGEWTNRRCIDGSCHHLHAVESYIGASDRRPFFSEEPLTFNMRQERLHRLAAGDRLWLVSRCPEDGQYYFVAVLRIEQLIRNPPGSEKATLFGEYAIRATGPRATTLAKGSPPRDSSCAFTFETGRAIKYGASIGQSLQSLRLLDSSDERVLDAALGTIQRGESPPFVTSCGLWNEMCSVFAGYFLKNWHQCHYAGVSLV